MRIVCDEGICVEVCGLCMCYVVCVRWVSVSVRGLMCLLVGRVCVEMCVCVCVCVWSGVCVCV